MTRLANGMNQPPIAKPLPKRCRASENISALAAARYIQMIQSTVMASATRKKNPSTADTDASASRTARVAKNVEPEALSCTTERALSSTGIATSARTPAMPRRTLVATARPRTLRNCVGGGDHPPGIPGTGGGGGGEGGGGGTPHAPPVGWSTIGPA